MVVTVQHILSADGRLNACGEYSLNISASSLSDSQLQEAVSVTPDTLNSAEFLISIDLRFVDLGYVIADNLIETLEVTATLNDYPTVTSNPVFVIVTFTCPFDPPYDYENP